MTDYSTATLSMHGCSDFRLVRYCPDNANSLNFEVSHPGGPEYQITLFDLPGEKAKAIADLFGVEPYARKEAA